MKTKNLISVLALVIMMIVSTTAFGQNEKNRVALKGTAVMVSDNAADWGLEVSGKLVVGKTYKHFKTPDGKFFAVEAKDGKMGVCNDKGEFLFPCKYFKATVVSDVISIIETSGSKPKFYNTSNPSVEVVAKEMSAGDLNKEIANNSPAGTYFDPNDAKQVRAVKQAQAASAAAPFGAFEFRANSKGKMELLVDGKVIFTAMSFNLISNADNYNKTNGWFFVVSDYVGSREQYGLFVLGIGNVDGKKVVEDLLAVPYEYSFVSQYEAMVVKCTTWSGAPKYFDWFGEPFDITKKGGK